MYRLAIEAFDHTGSTTVIAFDKGAASMLNGA